MCNWQFAGYRLACNLFSRKLNNDFSQGKNVVFGLPQSRVRMEVQITFGKCYRNIVFVVSLSEKGD